MLGFYLSRPGAYVRGTPLLSLMTDHFNATFDLYEKDIFRYCFWECRDRELGQDLTQETFLRFWTCLQRNELILNPRSFLYRIAHNLIVDHVRRKKDSSLDQLIETGYEPAIDPWQKTYSQLDAERLLQKLRKMRSPSRQLLHRRFIQELAPAEIATITGESANTISVRIFRGLKELRFSLNAPVRQS